MINVEKKLKNKINLMLKIIYLKFGENYLNQFY